ncbi:hypothetical protein EG19_06290 [Thermoanaerobaculum aquaticum]|uniref:Tetratricopeptide repeat protein n=1 Tax=Thermoanaerobaculum aquaticum TaxID=1312852 RepID=A0A062XXX2_9BACT|nr:hypothetical protein [Thermoanaerobaculum aquaticum]KDA53355.1 hypothetical protein EG19_06290 [Thermoanaerobaculum aquaticum]
MSYPGSPDKDPKVQQRILAAFREAVRLYQDGHRDECQTVLHSILEVDPAFRPAQRLESAIIQGLPVDLASLLGDLAGEAGSQVEGLLSQARQALAERNFSRAAELAQGVLRELPGHQEARSLLQQAQTAQKAQSEVATQLARARQALAAGLVEEAKGFLALVRGIAPDHPELAELEGLMASQTPGEAAMVEFETFTPPPSPPTPPPSPADRVELEAPWESAAQKTTSGFSFDAVGEVPTFSAEPAVPESPEEKVAALLAEGQEAFDRGDYAQAVDVWTRIYLIDPHNQEAERRIEQARRRREELDRLAEMKYAEALEAFEGGRLEEARELLQEVLSLQPQHVDANDLLARLETPSAPPPLRAELPAVEEDLFRDDFVPQEIVSGESAAVSEVPLEERAVPRPVRPAVKARRLALPLPVMVGVGVAVVVLVVLGLVLGGRVFQSGPSVEDTLQEAERLAQQGQLQDAIKLLQTLNLEGPEANQVQQRILEYQKKLKVQAPPPPTVDLAPAKQALGEGRYLKAALVLRAAAKKAPHDEGVRQLLGQVAAYDPGLPALADAWEKGSWEVASRALATMVEAHPQDGELRQAWQVARYNWSLELLRGFQVADAAKVLGELAKETNDPEVGRLHELARAYLSRSVDPRYKIFVNSLSFRELP